MHVETIGPRPGAPLTHRCIGPLPPPSPPLPSTNPSPGGARRTCEADLLVAEQAEDGVVQLHVSAVVLLHLPQDAHQLRPGLGGVRALALVRRQLVEGALPGAANPLVLALSHPGNTRSGVTTVTEEEEGGVGGGGETVERKWTSGVEEEEKWR